MIKQGENGFLARFFVMLTVLPENLLVSKIVQGHLTFRESIHVARVNKELHARTLIAVHGFYADRIKRFWGRCVNCWSTALLVKRFRETCRLSRAGVMALE